MRPSKRTRRRPAASPSVSLRCLLRRRPYSTQYVVYRDDEPVVLDIEYDMDPYIREQTQGDPLDCWPAEGGVPWNMIVEKDGKRFDLTSVEEDAFADMIFKEQTTCQ